MAQWNDELLRRLKELQAASSVMADSTPVTVPEKPMPQPIEAPGVAGQMVSGISPRPGIMELFKKKPQRGE